MFVIGTDTFVVAPLLPTLSDKFYISTDISGWLISAYALGYALFALVAGPWSDGRDRRRVLLSGLVGFIVMTALCGFAQGFWMMILFRFFAGASAAFVSPQIWASIPVLVKPEQIVRTMGSATAGLAIAQVVGIPLGAWLGAISWHMTFWAISGASIVLWLVLFKVFPPVPSRLSSSQNRIFSTYGTLLRNRTLRLYLLAYLVFQTGNFEALSFFGSWFHKDFGLGLRSIGLAMMVLGTGFAIGSLFGSHLVHRLGQYRSLFMAIVTLIVFYCILPFSPNLAMALIVLALVMMVAGFVFPVFMSTLLAQTETARGTVSSLANAAMYTGTTIGGVVGGILLHRISGFFGVASFTILAYLASLGIYTWAGAFRKSLHEVS